MTKKLFTIVIAIVLIAITLCALMACNEGKKQDDLAINIIHQRMSERAAELAKLTLDSFIDKDLYKDQNEIFIYDSFNPCTKEFDGEASVWHYTSVLAMTNRLVSIINDTEKDYFGKYVADLWDGLDWYKGKAEITSYRSRQLRTMYAVQRAKEKNTADISGENAVYDDQMWIIRELLATYANTSDTIYLQAAEELADNCLDGWDDTINPETNVEFGGITWGPGYASKHTCSNAPLIAPLVDLYDVYNKKGDADSKQTAVYYLDWAKKIYDFCIITFMNSNHLYGDLVGTTFVFGEYGLKETQSQGTLDISQYTYNTGTMMQGGAKLYKATDNKKYLTDTQNTAEEAYRVFGKLDTDTNITAYPTTSTLWFNYELLLGFVDLAYVDDSKYSSNNERYVESFREALDYAYDNYNYQGFLPRNFTYGWDFEADYDQKKDVMDCAANAEMYALLSQYYSAIKH